MKKSIYFAILLALVSITGVSAVNYENQRVCTVTSTILNGNHLDFQVPHFMCCADDGYCRMGNTLFKHLRLDDWGWLGSHTEADIRVNSYNGFDHIYTTVRLDGLVMNRIYTAWLVDTSSGESLRIGMFKANRMGRAFISSKASVLDFNIFDQIIVKDGNTTVLGGDITFTTTSS